MLLRPVIFFTKPSIKTIDAIDSQNITTQCVLLQQGNKVIPNKLILDLRVCCKHNEPMSQV